MRDKLSFLKVNFVRMFQWMAMGPGAHKQSLLHITTNYQHTYTYTPTPESRMN